MTVLGIETSTEVCSVGLADEQGRTKECSLVESRIHSEKLLTLVQQVCEDGNTPLGKVDAFAISIGPGSFTGLRIGLSSTKGLCYALGKPIVAVPTFQAVAEAIMRDRQEVKDVLVCIDAKQGDFYVGSYEAADGSARPRHEVGIRKLEEVGVLMAAGQVVATDRVQQLESLAADAGSCSEIHKYYRGDSVAGIGLRKLLAHDVSDLASLEPRYLKDFIVRPLS
ncbi:MAG: tRNA (adenosine(37)-N6)-threonylcarbamoyltransferase complex dimerization subunit type 1 TsaB [Bacteroidota bacterium]